MTEQDKIDEIGAMNKVQVAQEIAYVDGKQKSGDKSINWGKIRSALEKKKDSFKD